MKKTILLMLFLTYFVAISHIDARSRQFILGADISWVDADIDKGQKYYDGDQQKDILQILKEHKFNAIRLRLFVDPSAYVPGEEWDNPYSTKGYCGLERTVAFAKKIKDAGMLFLLDFHYSDTWADPGKQHKPMSWRNLSYPDLVKKVRSYTRESLEAFKNAGALPDMVQIGNEIVAGMIWPDGSTSNMKQFAELINAGIDGVKDVNEDIEIVIHSLSNKNPSGWLSNLINAGVKRERIDIFGLSYYQQYHGTTHDLMNNLTGITRAHDVKIMVAEYAEVHEQVNDIVFNLPDEKGIGTFVWEPTRWNETLFTNGRTNYRIDIYPNLWARYGNDTLPLKNIPVANRKPFGIIEQESDGHLWIDGGGVLRRGNRAVTGYSIFDLKGRLVATDRRAGSARLLDLPSGNVYIISVHGDQKRDMQRGLHCIR